MERWEQLEQLFLGRWSPASNRADMALRDACKRISESEAERDALRDEVARLRSAARLRWREEWHDDVGPVLWFVVPVREPPFFVGTPHDSDWPSSEAGPDHLLAWCELPDLRSDGLVARGGDA